MKFDLLQKDPQTNARAVSITTDHGVIETPIFMPVGTVASVKGVHQRELKEEINPDNSLLSLGLDSLKITDDLMRNGIDVYFVNLKEEDPSDMGFEKVTTLIKKSEETSFSDLMRMRLLTLSISPRIYLFVFAL